VVAKRLHWRTGRKGPTKLSRDFRSNFRHFNGAQGRNRIVCDAIELEAFFEWLFSSVPVNVPSA
jgi:hypothetical protein